MLNIKRFKKILNLNFMIKNLQNHFITIQNRKFGDVIVYKIVKDIVIKD